MPIANSRPRFEKIASPAAAMDGEVEQVRLPEPQQQARDGQHGDGQHERAAHLLQARRTMFFMDVPTASAERTTAAQRRASARARVAASAACADERLHLPGSPPAPRRVRRMPSPIRSGTAAGSDASPPQTATGRVLPRAPLRRPADQAQHGRMQRVEPAASCGCPRSIASVYCVRSLVPIEKKVGFAARSGRRDSAAAGVSIMAPIGIGVAATELARGSRSTHRAHGLDLRGIVDHGQQDAAARRAIDAQYGASTARAAGPAAAG